MTNAEELRAAGFVPSDFARLPGGPLDLRVGPGGERWHLDGKPLHAGAALELLTASARAWCPTCGDDGPANPSTCPDCGGCEQWIRPAWVSVRFEYWNAGDGSGSALLYLALPGLNSTDRHAIEIHNGDGARLRWPAGGGR